MNERLRKTAVAAYLTISAGATAFAGWEAHQALRDSHPTVESHDETFVDVGNIEAAMEPSLGPSQTTAIETGKVFTHDSSDPGVAAIEGFVGAASVALATTTLLLALETSAQRPRVSHDITAS